MNIQRLSRASDSVAGAVARSSAAGLLLWLCFLGTLAGCREADRDASTRGASGLSEHELPQKAASPETREVPQSAEQPRSAEQPHSAEQYVAEIADLLKAGDPHQAWERATEALIHYPADAKLQFMAARVQEARGDKGAAIALLEQIPIDAPEVGLPARGQAAQWQMEQGDLLGAEKNLLSVLRLVPDAIPAHRLLAQIYSTQARPWESAPHLYSLIAAGDFNDQELFKTINFREPYPDRDLQRVWMASRSEDPFRDFVEVRGWIENRQYERALQPLEMLHEAHPRLVEPWVWLGNSYLWLERFDDLTTWLEAAPDGAEQHPEYWYVRGRWAMAESDPGRAAEFLTRALRLDPRHLAAHQGLSEALLAAGKRELAADVRERGEALAQIHDYARQFMSGYSESEALERVIESYQRLGDDFGVVGWSLIRSYRAGEQPPQSVLALQATLRGRRSVEPPGLLQRTASVDIRKTSAPEDEGSGTRASAVAGAIQFVDVSQEVGIEASYHGGGDIFQGLMTYESLGGGVAAFDFDNDAFCDFYFSDAGAAPHSESGFRAKQLYRSMAGKQFVECAEKAGLNDLGYGQGLASGDYDADGFADLLVANIGSLRLYRNQGDGTFREVPVPQAPADEDWNSCVALCDISGDGLPDIFQGAYIQGPEVFERECGKPGVVARNCNPKDFPPAPNHLYVNDGVGGWRPAGEASTAALSGGYSLGALVTDIDGQPGNEVFVANDLTANALLKPRGRAGNGELDLADDAALAGVAVDGEGRAQACMGIGFGDIDRNGLSDLVVSNFHGEVNTVYLQRASGVFVDGTRDAQLHRDSVDQLGFGCQLFDANNDGWLDLVVLNGHIDDYRGAGIPFQMQPQAFANVGGRFQLRPAVEVGTYFEQPALGRSLQTSDFNNDGRVDLVATHLDRRAALLQNTGATAHRWVQFRLVGVRCDREAIGARVELRSSDGIRRAVLAKGDGYYGSSQPLLQFGLGRDETIESVEVYWPDGEVQVLPPVDAGQRHLVVQGQGVWPG